jgi:hypothetical protein
MLSFGLASASYHWIELPFLAQEKTIRRAANNGFWFYRRRKTAGHGF